MFNRILVPLDQSSLAEQALGTAEAIAHASHGELSLVLAHRMAPYDGSLVGSWSDAKDPAESVYIRAIVDEVARGSGVTVGGTVATGMPAETICRRAREIGADLIVMTSHGRTGVSRAWLGSVADGVVRTASVPVLVLRATDDAPAMGRGHPIPLFRRILVPLDGSTTSSAILSSAAELAKCDNARLIFLRVVAPVPLFVIDPQIPAYPTNIEDPDATKQVADATREELNEVASAMEHEYSLNVETLVVVSGRTAHAILASAERHAADLIAMTTHGRGVSRFVLGSVTDKVLRGGHLPMLLLHPTAHLAGRVGVRSAAAVTEPSPKTVADARSA